MIAVLILIFVFALAAGLSLSCGFIIGFKTRIRYDDTGKFTGRVEVIDPIQVTDRMVRELEQEERDQDALFRER